MESTRVSASATATGPLRGLRATQSSSSLCRSLLLLEITFVRRAKTSQADGKGKGEGERGASASNLPAARHVVKQVMRIVKIVKESVKQRRADGREKRCVIGGEGGMEAKTTSDGAAGASDLTRTERSKRERFPEGVRDAT